MNKNDLPFLLNFKTEVPCVDEEEYEWGVRTSRPPTNIFTKPRLLKAGYTRSGKYKGARMTKSKTDRRAGK
tara:strand:- start:57 stop:269 length:213 start_codon:yes stop_codon:yes gene_type:complete